MKLSRRAFGGVLGGAVAGAPAVSQAQTFGHAVNAPRTYPQREYGRTLECVVDVAQDLGSIDRRIFGTNLEWFNEGGGLDTPDQAARARLVGLARDQKLSVFRFPGGTLADYYDWTDGVGPPARRPVRRHPTDPGRSANGFGSPEFFALLRDTGAAGLVTVNVGTGTPQQAADWVAYARRPGHAGRRGDGFADPVDIRLWEVGNEVYLPGNPGERKITQTPAVYAANFIAFADAIRQADPAAQVIAIGVARAHIGPDTEFPDWTETLLRAAAPRIDMIAVHNAYFPMLYNVSRPAVERVYKALWAAPEAVDRSLTALEALIGRFEADRRIGIAVTEWGALFSMPTLDPYWFDHVKTLGSGVYVARLLQVLMSHSRVQLANYFKFVDRSFMGWVDFNGQPKVPYWVFRLYAGATGDRRLAATVDSPTYDAAAIGIMMDEAGVPEVTVAASRESGSGSLFVNFVNRSLSNVHRVRLTLRHGPRVARGDVQSVSAAEPTAHNGVDIPPEWPMKPDYEPYTTAAPGSIGIAMRPWQDPDSLVLPPFSVATLRLRPPDTQW